MAVKTFAAIDIGSYYVNMEIFELSPKGGVRSLTRVRQNLETGRDTYVLHKITMDRLNELTAILKDYRRIMREFGVSDFRACAKSAFREADKLEADLVAGRTTKEQLIKEGRLFTSVEALLADLNS